jgi:dolichyl-phosphate-mannose--protein O-mannosyl transferase
MLTLAGFPASLSAVDVLLVTVLSLFSLSTHLWMIQHPDVVVFDEVHFGNFTNEYTNSHYFFDIHPPLGKLVMYLFSRFSQYDGSIHFIRRHGLPHINADYVSLRLTPAIFSALCCPMIYLTMRFLSFPCSASFTSAFLIACDTSFLAEHRFTLSDGMLHFFCCLFWFTTPSDRSPRGRLWLDSVSVCTGGRHRRPFCVQEHCRWTFCVPGVL